MGGAGPTRRLDWTRGTFGAGARRASASVALAGAVVRTVAVDLP